MSNIFSKATKSIIWSSFGSISYQIVRVVIQIALARFISPSDFGVFAVILALVNVASYFLENGFSLYYIRKLDVDDQDESTLLLTNIGFSVLLFIIIYTIAPFMDELFKNQSMLVYLLVGSLSILINAVGSLHRARLVRNLKFKEQTVYLLISALISGVIAIVLAYIGFDIWALIIYHLIFQALFNIMIVLKGEPFPKYNYKMKVFIDSFNFTWKLMISGFIHTFYESFFNIFVASQFGVTMLGFYNNALRIRDGASQSLIESIQKVTYPLLSMIQNENDSYTETNRNVMRFSMMIINPLLFGLIAIADPIIRLLFTQEWYGMIIVLQLLCLNGVFIPLQRINLNILTSLGRSDIYLKLEIWKKAFALSTIAIVIFLKLDINQLLLLMVLSGFFGYYINTIYAKALASYGFLNQMRDLAPSLLNASLMAIIVYGVGVLLNMHLAIQVVIQLIIGGLVYMIFTYITSKREVNVLIGFLSNIIKSRAI